jgi:hypothetical protein
MPSPPPAELADTPVRGPGIVSRAVDGGAMLVDLERGKVWELNRTGADAWALFDGQRSLGAIATELGGRYGVAVERLQTDLVELAASLAGEGLIVRAS